MDLDVVALSRAQFALTIMFHYLFPPLSIGLGFLMVLMEGLYLRTRDPQYAAMTRFWTRIFAVNFAAGVASGIVMEFQFGTNWATYSRFVGDVFGSALAAEGIFAFFLESGFLAVLVFGWDRVSPRVHFISTLMVFLGSCFSAVWIVVANSWQQTPAGFHVVGEGAMARAEITDFWAMVFNPSAMHRLNHVLLGSLILGAFFVMSVSAWYLLRARHQDFAKKSFRVALVVGALSSVAILVSGHAQAKSVAEHQPAKMAAIEGHFHQEPGQGAALYLFGWPDEVTETVKFGVALPNMLSVLLHEDPSAPVTPLAAFAPEDRPPVLIPFLTYHVMVALGMYFIGITALGLWMLRGGRLWRTRWLLWVYVVSVVGPYIANQTGWVAAEVGRQPWVVYGLLRTKDAVSAVVPADQVLASIVMFSLIYLALGAVWLFVVNEKIQHGPEAPDELPPPVTGGWFGATAVLAPGQHGLTGRGAGGPGPRASAPRGPQEHD
jgi:cytochrome d ubiquinol oxidase subunit I